MENLWPRFITSPLGKLPSDGKLLLETLRPDKGKAAASHAAWFAGEAVACQEQALYEEARSWLDKGLEHYPENILLLSLQGVNFLELQELNQARDSCLKLLPRVENQPNVRSMVLNNLAYADALLGTADLLGEADRYSEEAMAVLSWVPAVKGTRGTVLAALGRMDEGIRLLRDSMQQADGSHGKAQNACWLAIAEAKRGNLAQAKQYLEEARKLDPKCSLLDRAQKVLGQTPPFAA